MGKRINPERSPLFSPGHQDMRDVLAYCVVAELPESIEGRMSNEIDWALDSLVRGLPRSWLYRLSTEDFQRRMDRLSRILCDAGIRTPNLLVENMRLEWRNQQRDMVAAIGCCHGGCRTSNLRQNKAGETVCRRTGQVCPWNDDVSLAIAKMFDWQGTISIQERRVCPQT